MKLIGTYLGILLWISMLYAAGMYLFTKGFLLTRIEIAEKSGKQMSLLAGSLGEGTNSERVDSPNADRARAQLNTFRRAVVVLIDALRYDFASFNQTLAKKDEQPFQNKLPIIHEMVSKYPEQAALFKSLADPPTTTLQRLKGILTGSLPTFVDAGHNFASFEISEDNVIDQLLQAEKRTVFMGDDTWMTLFRNKFHRAFPFPSFNVKDLHTVDEGILAHLVPEMRKGDWDVIIAHFLGVDHCGHSLGPYHPSMGKKLTQMNSVVKSVIQNLDDDTVLFVLGDHGMTRTGDHGGDSPEELASALFVYSNRKLLDQTDQKMLPDTVSQIDFVPTFSVLLGIPIPFSSLGAIIPPFFSSSLSNSLSSKAKQPDLDERLQKSLHRLRAHRYNAQQVHTYIEAYNKLTDDFPAETHSNLEKTYATAEKKWKRVMASLNSDVTEDATSDLEASLHDLETSYRNYVIGIREMCRSVWAKFEMPNIYQGVILVLFATILGALIVTVQHYTDMEKMTLFLQNVLRNILLSTTCASVVTFVIEASVMNLPMSMPFILSMVSICVFLSELLTEISQVNFSKLLRSMTLSSVLQFTLVLSPAVFHSVFLTSDSHVINEGRAIVFFVQSLVVIVTIVYTLRQYKSFALDKSRGFKFDRMWSSPVVRAICTGLVMMICVRLSSLFVSCREEQYWCTQSPFLQPLSLLTSGNSSIKNYRYFISIACIAALPSCLMFHFNQNGNMSSDSGQVYSIRYALPLASVCICMYWGLQALPEKIREDAPAWQTVFFPQVAYLMIIIAVIFQWAWPLNLLIIRRTSGQNQSANPVPNQSGSDHGTSESANNGASDNGNGSGDSNVSKHKNKADAGADDSEELPPLVYGLSTVFSATYLHAAVALGLLIALLSCDGLAAAVVLMVVEMVLFLEMYSATRRKQLAPLAAMPNLYSIGFFSVPWYAVAGWSLMATQFFFATGHQATFTAIKFESAYVGFDGDFPRYLYFIPAGLVSLNTFASQVFFAGMLPLLLIWPFTRGLWVTRNKVVTEEEQQGELNLHTYSAEALRALFQICIMFLVFQACDLLGTMFAAAILRRHLMAWSVFAPRFIFQGVSFGIVMATILVTFVFFVNIQKRLARWIRNIES